MTNNKVNRLTELNKLLFQLYAPKKGDKVKFKIRGHDEVFEGMITSAQRVGNQIKYSMVSHSGSSPVGDMRDIVIIECNGIRFEDTNVKMKDFKPL